MQNPALSSAIRLSPVENGYFAYDTAADRLHELNPVAALILELCDGTRPIEEVRELVQPVLPDGNGEQIDQWIKEAIEAGLFTWSNGDSHPRQELSAEELIKLRKKLRHNGKIEAAYRCQRRVTDLLPNDAAEWDELAELAHILGLRDQARAAYERYLEIVPDDAETKHLLVALRDEPAPPRASDDCIQQLYHRFSSFYEFNMREELSYEGPERLHDLLKTALEDRQNLSVLDLGCGSGLAGLKLKPLAAHMTGVDLSPEMIKLAEARNTYDKLEVAEITRWLAAIQEGFDLIAACDCLIYFGDLRQVILPAAQRLNEGGLLAFSVERGEQYPFRLTDNGRYTHTVQHVREAAAEAGLEVAGLREEFLRMEYGEDVTAIYAVLKKA